MQEKASNMLANTFFDFSWSFRKRFSWKRNTKKKKKREKEKENELRICFNLHIALCFSNQNFDFLTILSFIFGKFQMRKLTTFRWKLKENLETEQENVPSDTSLVDIFDPNWSSCVARAELKINFYSAIRGFNIMFD